MHDARELAVILLVQNGMFDIHVRPDLLKSKNNDSKLGLSHDHLRSKRVYLSPESAKFLKKLCKMKIVCINLPI